MFIMSYKIHLFIIALALFTLSILISTQTVVAHPGNTASDGAHYCWTNCSYWGYEYGTRHSHGEPEYYYTPTPTVPSATEQGVTNGRKHAESINRDYIIKNATLDGEQDGSSVSLEAELSESSVISRASEFCSEKLNFNKEASNEYISAFQSSYFTACKPIYEKAYTEAYTSTKSKLEKPSDAPGTAPASSSVIATINSNTLYLLLGGLGVFGSLYGAYVALKDD